MVHGHMCVGLRHGYNDHGEGLRSLSVSREGRPEDGTYLAVPPRKLTHVPELGSKLLS